MQWMNSSVSYDGEHDTWRICIKTCRYYPVSYLNFILTKRISFTVLKFKHSRSGFIKLWVCLVYNLFANFCSKSNKNPGKAYMFALTCFSSIYTFQMEDAETFQSPYKNRLVCNKLFIIRACYWYEAQRVEKRKNRELS